MTTRTTVYSASTQPNNHSLLAALLMATVVHTVILLNIKFSSPLAVRVNRSIDLTLARPAQIIEAPRQQQTTPAVTNKTVTTATNPQNHKPANPGKTVARSPAVEPQKQLPVKPPASKAPPPDPTPQTLPEKPSLTAETLQQQITQLGEQIRYSTPNPQQAKIKFVNSVSSHKFLANQYTKDWEDKVERTGNLNYPDAARTKGEDQTLTMDVGINADGSIYSMRIVKSSGNPQLDEAAKRIVKMSAPFAALPYELLQEVNVLVITKGWKFSDHTGMTAR
jgi:protein TonB